LPFPNADLAARDREKLIAKLKRDLARFERIPEDRRQDECADEGEQTCRTLLAEMGCLVSSSPRSKRAKPSV
jgi:hypothetical protein